MPSVKYYTELDLTSDNKIVNLKNPTLDQDAATKRYVDLTAPYSLGGDIIYQNPTGSVEVYRHDLEHAGYGVNSSGVTVACIRVMGLTPGHRIRCDWEWRGRGGGYVNQYLWGYLPGGVTAIISAGPQYRTNGSVWYALSQTITLTNGCTELDLATNYVQENDFRNVRWTDLDAASPSRLPIGADASRLSVVGGLPLWVPATGRVEIGLDGHGNSPQPGVRADFLVPYPMRVTGWTVVADAVGSAQLDLWRAAYADFPPTVEDSVTGTDKPRLSSEIKAQSSALTGWVTDWAADDLVRINLDSADTLTRATAILSFNRI